MNLKNFEYTLLLPLSYSKVVSFQKVLLSPLYSETSMKRRAKGLATFVRGFVISRFFFIYFTITGAKKIVRYTKDFVK